MADTWEKERNNTLMEFALVFSIMVSLMIGFAVIFEVI